MRDHARRDVRPELRAWVASVGQWETGGQPASPGRPASYGSASTAAGAAPSGRRRLPTRAIVLIILAVLFIIVAGILGAVIPSLIFRTTETLADEVTSVGLSRYVTSWPVNSYTDPPMANGGGAGAV